MPLVRSSRRSSSGPGNESRQRVRRRGSHRHRRARAIAWTDALEAPVAMQRRQLIAVCVALLAGWSSLLAATVAAFS